jgi:DNA-binding MarR family transcriptional regulator
VDDDLGTRLLSAVARLNRWATRNAGMAGSIAAWRLLAAIDELGPSRIGELARVDNCSQPTVTGQVRRLEDAGWVQRETDPVDARAVRIALTPAGAANLRSARASRSAVLAPRLAELTPAQRRTLADAVVVLEQLAAPSRPEAPLNRATYVPAGAGRGEQN